MSARPLATERSAFALFEEALALAPGERAAFVAGRCAGDATLAARVQALLAADAAASEADAGGPAAPPAALRPPERIGPWRIEALIGAGGMGAVYRARRSDGLFEQRVAIKFVRPRPGGAAAEALVAAERQLLARMEHPSIARILDGGTTPEGLHHLVVEHVEGEALDRHVAAQVPTLRGRVGLLRRVCAAVSHAHGHGVLHNDLKPANVLVTADGTPKLIDFGVARLTDRSDAALPQGFTRGYASPQRLAGEPPVVADEVYALGRMLAGLLDGAPADAELQAVVARACAPERANRYATVGAFDDDLRRWEERRPLEALPPDWRYRARKLVQRHPWRVAAGALAGLSLVVALGTITALYTRADAARRDAELRFDQLRQLARFMLFDLDTRLEATPGTTVARREMVGRAQQYLDGLAATAGGNRALQAEVAAGLARLAEVQGVPGRPNVGEPAAADRNLARAEAMLAGLATAPGADWTLWRELGNARHLRALALGRNLSSATAQLAKAREAEADLQRAIALAGGAPAADRADLAVRLLGTRLVQGDALRWLDRHAEAEALQRAEEQRLSALPAELAREIDGDAQSARIAIQHGDSLYYLGRVDEAAEAYRRGTEAMRRTLARRPNERRALEGVLIGAWNLSGTLTDLQRHAESLAEIERVLPLADRLVALDPANGEARRMQRMVTNQQAVALAALRRWDEAIALTARNVAAVEAEWQRAPDDGDLARSVAVPLRGLAEFHAGKGDMAGACRVLRRAQRQWALVDTRFGLSPSDRRTELAVVDERLRACPPGD